MCYHAALREETPALVEQKLPMTFEYSESACVCDTPSGIWQWISGHKK